MPDVSAEDEVGEAEEEGAPVPPPRTRAQPSRGLVRNGREISQQLLAPLRQRRGVRIGCIGSTGSGKSWALRKIVADALPLVDVAYIHDDTEDCDKWGGQKRIDLRDCHDRALIPRSQGGSNAVVFTGDPFLRRQAVPEHAAVDAWMRAAHGFTCLVALDEMALACSAEQRWTAPLGDLPRILTQGRKPGISLVYANQDPQCIPRAALSQAHLLIFRLDGREVTYLLRHNIITPDLAALIPQLQEGQFVPRILGFERDTNVYRF